MADNNRIYYPNQQISFKSLSIDDWVAVRGVQSVGIATSWNIEQIFELGQLSIYENIEAIPEIETSITKVLDGNPLLYLLATSGAATDDLATRSSASTFLALGIWPETSTSAAGTPSQQVEMSGLVVGSVGYDFSVDGDFTENITLNGNDKVWLGEAGDCIPGWATAYAPGAFPDNKDAPPSGVQRRQDFNLGGSQLPVEATGYGAKVQSISVSVDLGREDLFELGTLRPYAKVVNFPVEVNCDIEVLSVSGDLVSAVPSGCSTAISACGGVGANSTDQQITISICDGTTINLGAKNRLSSINYGGGDAGGGNATVTYSYITFNDFEVTQ